MLSRRRQTQKAMGWNDCLYMKFRKRQNYEGRTKITLPGMENEEGDGLQRGTMELLDGNTPCILIMMMIYFLSTFTEMYP